MNKETEDRDLLPQHDFSGGVRGKYAARFRETRRDVLKAAAALDRHAWLAHSLLAFQAFEARLVAYRALVFGEDTNVAGRTVSTLLEGIEGKASESLWNDLHEHTSADEVFREQLLELIADRNWLVHRSFHDLGRDVGASVGRLESIAERSADLTERLSSYLLERCTAKGMEGTEIEARAQEVVGRWAAGRDAA